MAECDQCGREENLPYECRHCGGTYCSQHRLPENHDCPGLQNWGEPDDPRVFDSGFDDGVDDRGGSGSMADRLGLSTGRGGTFAYFRGNMSFLFLAIMWGTFGLQWLVLLVGGEALHNAIFVLSSERLLWVWTWFTSIFAHSPLTFFHIVGNSIVLYFFGPIVEKRVGSRNFVLLFFGAGIAAGLAQTGLVPVMDTLGMPTEPVRVLGASGAIMAVMGVLTVLAPKLRVYLWFLLPVPLWLLTIGFAAFSVLMVASGRSTGGGIAHLAHLAGLVIGLAYGEKLRRDGARAPNQLQIGGGGPGGPGGRGPGGRRRF
jgi:membrane associated rhomboid family serine protease